MRREFDVAVVELANRRLIGLKTHPTLARLQEDCLALWRRFGERLHELPGGGRDGAYGVSHREGPQELFAYRTAVAAEAGVPVPKGMEESFLPGGWYAQCPVSGLGGLGEAYAHLYGPWIQEAGDFVADRTVPCFQYFPHGWSPATPFFCYMPLVRRNRGAFLRGFGRPRASWR